MPSSTGNRIQFFRVSIASRLPHCSYFSAPAPRILHACPQVLRAGVEDSWSRGREVAAVRKPRRDRDTEELYTIAGGRRHAVFVYRPQALMRLQQRGRVCPHAYAWRLRVDTKPPCLDIEMTETASDGTRFAPTWRAEAGSEIEPDK